MNFWSRLPSVVMVVLAFGVATVFLPSLSGCVMQNSNPVARWVSSITGAHGLPSETMGELARFEKEYKAKAVEGAQTDRQFKQFIDAFKVIRQSYVKQIPDKDLISYAIEGLNDPEDVKWLEEDDGTPKGKAKPVAVIDVALDAMLAKLDPHSGYMTPDEFAELMVDTSGEFGGLGIEVQKDEQGLKVVSPIEDTPADKAGLKPGDHITHVDDASIVDWELIKIVKLLRGKPGTAVTVRVVREDEEVPFDVSIVRDIIQVKAVRSAVYDDYLHLRVTAFSERMEEDVLRAFEKAEEETDGNLKGVILDVRNNPGGLLDQAVALTDFFIEKGNVVSIRGRKAENVRNFNAKSGDLAYGLPVVVLINGGSASASEIVSGALQDHNRAILMGRRSFGKGSVQTILPLLQEGAVRITTALYYLPSGRTIQKVGVAPDIRLDLPKKKNVEAKKDEEEADKAGAQAKFDSMREADLPNVIDAKKFTNDTKHNKDGVLGNAMVTACPEIGPKKDRELGCALEFLKAGSAKRFLAGIDLNERG